MEREYWREVRRVLDQVGDRRPKWCEFTDQEIVRVFLWAVLHDRPISWACRPASWPIQVRRCRLPSCSTMSRRLRSLGTMKLLGRAIRLLRILLSPARRMLVDGKPLCVSKFSKDRQAKRGYAVGGHARGYKLHALCDENGNLLAWDVRSMNEAESVVARRLISRSRTPGATIYGDASYDSNRLHAIAENARMRLLAPRGKPGRGLGHHRQHPARIRCIATLEGDPAAKADYQRHRQAIERYFGQLTSFGGGLNPLPSWVRTRRRVRRWVLGKLLINAIRCRLLAFG
jgi:hypothetical protein